MMDLRKMEEPPVNAEEQRALLRWVRATIEAAVRGQSLVEIPEGELTNRLRAPHGVFVTLKEKGELRGCIGKMDFERPLWSNALEAAVASALEDPRFPPVMPEELPEIAIEISILNPPVDLPRPDTDVKNVRAALKAIRDIFMVRSCNYFIDAEVVRKRKIKVCLDYHIKKCEGPCEGLVSAERYNGMIDQIATLLRGKTESLIRALREEMEALAAKTKFEEAALLRDRIKGLEAYSERQKAVDLDPIDRDIFAFATEGDDACGVIFKLRDGKMIGRHHYYMGNVEGKPQGEILEALLQQYYLEAEDVPGEIFLPVPLENAGALQQWLSKKAGGSVTVASPTEGEEAKIVRLAASNAKFLLDELKLQRMKRADYVPQPLLALQKDLRLPKIPRTIECFDISNIQGADSVASMVVFVDGKPRKSQYRKFKIRTVVGPDDFASMREVIHRRYQRLLDEQQETPDLVMVDGGKGQLSSAVDVLRGLGLSGIPIVGLAKRLEEVFLPEQTDPEFIPKSSSGLRLLQQVRDEAHRFAITFHRNLRSKRTLTSELDLIQGIGEKRAKELLEVFGSVQGVKFASAQQLAEVVGEKVADKIKTYFEEGDEAAV